MAKAPASIDKICKINVFAVHNVILFEDILKLINKCNNHQTISMAAGYYPISRTIDIKRDNLSIIGKVHSPDTVIIAGDAMSKTARIGNLFKVSGNNFFLAGVTLEKSGLHLIQIAGEKGAQSPTIRDCILRDSYQQMIKVTYGKKKSKKVKNGTVENCHFSYSKGIGPNWYIGGIDAHGIVNWNITANTFKNIASPIKQEAEHAIHIWNSSENNRVVNNTIINCDRGIGFGLGKRKGNTGGTIKSNKIYHANNEHKFSDVAISLESSPNSLVLDNLIISEHGYPYAIEYRFNTTLNISIEGNISNKPIKQRNGAKASLSNNRLLNKIEAATLRDDLFAIY